MRETHGYSLNWMSYHGGTGKAGPNATERAETGNKVDKLGFWDNQLWYVSFSCCIGIAGVIGTEELLRKLFQIFSLPEPETNSSTAALEFLPTLCRTIWSNTDLFVFPPYPETVKFEYVAKTRPKTSFLPNASKVVEFAFPPNNGIYSRIQNPAEMTSFNGKFLGNEEFTTRFGKENAGEFRNDGRTIIKVDSLSDKMRTVDSSSEAAGCCVSDSRTGRGEHFF